MASSPDFVPDIRDIFIAVAWSDPSPRRQPAIYKKQEAQGDAARLALRDLKQQATRARPDWLLLAQGKTERNMLPSLDAGQCQTWRPACCVSGPPLQHVSGQELPLFRTARTGGMKRNLQQGAELALEWSGRGVPSGLETDRRYARFHPNLHQLPKTITA